MLKDRIEYSKKLCKEMANNHGNFILDLINDLETIYVTRCCKHLFCQCGNKEVVNICDDCLDKMVSEGS